MKPKGIRSFTKSLLTDLNALERMLNLDMIESDIRRMGVEQEMFIVNEGWRPAPVAMELLQGLPDCFTTELALFNIELNLAPLELSGNCFTRLENELNNHVKMIRGEAGKIGADIVLTGILPSLIMSDLDLVYMTPRERYSILNKALSRLSGGNYHLHIQGSDDLQLTHDSVMLEGCNTSFQVHLQVSPEEFAHFYNVAQVILAPTLALSVNSPVLFNRRLWAETRIALFQQALDTGRTTPHLRELTPRVRFGEHWIKTSILEVFKEDIARFPALFGATIKEDSVKQVEDGQVPELKAIQLYNSTIYRWNRPCYGICNNKPHIRIECRALPSGPSTLDEVANAAFWIGAVIGVADQYDDITRAIAFGDARANFRTAAMRGLNAGFTWLNGQIVSAPELILNELIDFARDGLLKSEVDSSDIDRYLGIIKERVRKRYTGSRWLLSSLEKMESSGTRSERMAALTSAIVKRQKSGKPCHEWELADIEEGGGWRFHYLRVEQYMTTDLFTVKETELVDLAALVMDWKRVRQVLVEDDRRRLVGIVSYGQVLHELAGGRAKDQNMQIPIKDIMDKNPISVSPETSTLEAIKIMRKEHVTCLPVVKNHQLVGIVSEGDIVPIAERLLEDKLSEEPGKPG